MREVRVRLKTKNKRYLGIVELPALYNRFSDFLNGDQDFLKLLHPEFLDSIDPASVLLVNKKNISYIQTIEEEYIQQPFATLGSFFRVTVKLKEETIKGLIFCSFEETDYPMEGILRQKGYFVNIKNPVIVETSEKYNFLAVGKSNILTMEIDPTPVKMEKKPVHQASLNE